MSTNSEKQQQSTLHSQCQLYKMTNSGGGWVWEVEDEAWERGESSLLIKVEIGETSVETRRFD